MRAFRFRAGARPLQMLCASRPRLLSEQWRAFVKAALAVGQACLVAAATAPRGVLGSARNFVHCEQAQAQAQETRMQRPRGRAGAGAGSCHLLLARVLQLHD